VQLSAPEFSVGETCPSVQISNVIITADCCTADLCLQFDLVNGILWPFCLAPGRILHFVVVVDA